MSIPIAETKTRISGEATTAQPSSPMPPMLPLELTLIVAATSRTMGIGRAGGLPWTGLKKEMAYFRKVTQGVPPSETTAQPPINTVLMGRKTYNSIPPKFRPLANRVNVVLSRSYSSPTAPHIPDSVATDTTPVNVPSLTSAVKLLSQTPRTSGGRVFVIGGAEIYRASLEEEVEGSTVKRILLTRVLTEVECDTFFPLKLEEDGSCQDGAWKRKSKEELEAWVGVAVPEGVQVEGGVEYSFEMWERD